MKTTTKFILIIMLFIILGTAYAGLTRIYNEQAININDVQKIISTSEKSVIETVTLIKTELTKDGWINTYDVKKCYHEINITPYTIVKP